MEMNLEAIRESAKMATVKALKQGIADGIADVVQEFCAGSKSTATTKPRAARKAAPRKAAPVKRAAPSARSKGVKRSPEDMAKMVVALGDHIRANPGCGAEEIAKALGWTTKELALPRKKLLAGGAIKVKGQKRAARYFPT